MLDKLWDDVVAGPQPDRGLSKLRKIMTAKPLTVNGANHLPIYWTTILKLF